MTFLKFCPVKRFFKCNEEKSDDDREKNQSNSYEKMHIMRKIAYGMGGPPMQMTSNAMGFYLNIFLLETANISPFHLSAVQVIARVWDAITDPITGYLASITNTRFGKFKPWMFMATPLSCLAFFFQFFVPVTSNQIIKCLYYSLMVMALQTGLTAFHVPYSSMCMVLTSEPRERDQLTSIRMAFEIVGILFGAGIFGGIALRNRVTNLGNITVTEELRNVEKRNYMEASASLCLIFVLCAISVLAGTKEQRIPIEMKKEPYLRFLKKILTFKPYLYIMFAFMFTSLGIQIIQNNLALYVTHTIKRPRHVTPGILMLLCCALILVPVGHKMMRRFGKKAVFFMGGINMFPVLISMMFLPENLHLGVYYFFMFWVSFSLMVAMVLPWSMLPDVIDLFMVEHGCRKDAAFYSFYVFFNKFAVGISLAISALALGAAGYKSGVVVQPKSVSNMLRYFIGVSGLFCFIASMIFLYLYPITEEKRRSIAVALEEMREEFKTSGKMTVTTTCESNLEIIDVGIPPTKIPVTEIENAAILYYNSQHNVDFQVGSGENLMTV